MKKLFILLVSLLVAGCSTVQYPADRSSPPPIGKAKPSIVNSTKNSAVQLGSKFKVYPYEPDHFDMIDIQENKNPEVPITFFKLKF
jgi:hypothetical protein